MSSMRPRLISLSIAICVGGLLASLGYAADEVHPEYRNFQLTGQYVLYVEGELVESPSIYHSERGAAYLVVAETFENAILILPRTGCVESVTAEELKEREDGGLDVLKEAETCALGRFRLVGPDVVFKVGDRPTRLKPKPPLEGTHYLEKVLEHTPEYGRAARSYRFDARALDRLKASEMEVRVQIFFGTWCSFCNRFIPNTIRVEQELAATDSKITFEYHGLPAPPAAWVTPEATRMRVRRLPTGFLFVGDKMIGRLEGNDWIRPESALSRFIR